MLCGFLVCPVSEGLSLKHYGVKYRLMLTETTAEDPVKVLDRPGKALSLTSATSLGISVTNHSRECIHAPVKASTLLLGIGKGDEGKVYLVDFGLACRYMQNGKHKQYKEDFGKALPVVEGGTHPCVMPTPRQHLTMPVHFRMTSPAAKLQGVVHVFSSSMQL
ncbi:hypothetical protein MTO96_034837 [Rhipicephalus appendiculatus]